MNLSRAGAMELIGYEAIVQSRYRDSVGVWTIGVGHTAAAGEPDPKTFTSIMTLEDVFTLFERDVQKYVAGVNVALGTRRVNQQQFDALVSFHYNTGRVKALIADSVERPPFGNYNRAGGKVSNALVTRRAGERHLYESGQYTNHGMALVIPASANGSLVWSHAKRVNLAQLLTGKGLISATKA